MDKLFLDAVPSIRIVGGLVHIAISGHPLVMQFSTFHAFVGAGTRAIRDFDATGAERISFEAAKAGRERH